MDSSFQLGVVLSLKDYATSELNKAISKFDEFKNSVNSSDSVVQQFETGMKRMNAGGLLLGAGFGLKSVFDGAIDESRKFEKELALLGATAEASALDMEKFEKAAIETGLATKFSPQEAASGLTALASAGIQGADAIVNALKPALDLAAASAGQSMSTTGAVMAALKNAGTTAVGSGEGVRMALSALMTPSAKAKEELQKLGVRVYDESGKFRDLIDIFEDLQVATSKMSEADRNAVIDKILLEGGTKAFLAVTNQGIENVRGFKSKLDESGTSAKFASRQIDTFEGSMNILNGTWQTAKVLLGQSLMPAVRMFVDGLTQALVVVVSFMQENKNFMKVAGWFLFGATSAAILVGTILTLNGAWNIMLSLMKANVLFGSIYNTTLTVLGSIKTWLTGITFFKILASKTEALATSLSNSATISSIAIENASGVSKVFLTAKTWSLIAATKTLQAVTMLLNSTLLANPVAWLVVGIVALVAVLYVAIKYWDEWTSKVKDFFGISGSTDKIVGEVKKYNKEIDELQKKKANAEKYGLTDEAKKYEAAIKAAESNRDAYQKLVDEEKEYLEFKKKNIELKKSLENDLKSGAIGTDSKSLESATSKLKEFEKNTKMTKEEWLKSKQEDLSKATESTKKLTNATEQLQKKQTQVKKAVQSNSSIDIIDINFGAKFNGGKTNLANIPELSNIQIPKNVLHSMGKETDKGLRSATQTIPISMNELTKQLDLVMKENGKKLGEAFSSEFTKGVSSVKWSEIQINFLKNLMPIYQKLISQARMSGAGTVHAFNSGVSQAGGQTQESGGFLGWVSGLRQYLPFSDAKKGPLANLTKSGKALVQTFVSGMEENKGLLDSSLNKTLELKPNKFVKEISHSSLEKNLSTNNSKTLNIYLNDLKIVKEGIGLEGSGKILEEIFKLEADRLEFA